MGVGSPGVVDPAGVVLSAPNLGGSDEHLQDALTARFGIPVIVGNDARAAVLAEHTFGGAGTDMMLIKVGHGVGSGLLLNGSLLFGSRFAAGEIGHVVVGTHGGAECACGSSGAWRPGWLARGWVRGLRLPRHMDARRIGDICRGKDLSKSYASASLNYLPLPRGIRCLRGRRG